MGSSTILGVPLPDGTSAPSGATQMTTAINGLEKFCVLVKATVAAFNTAVPSPTDGMLRFITATEAFEGRVSAAWKTLLDDRCGKGLRFEYLGGLGSNLLTNTVGGTIYTKTFSGFEANRTYRVGAVATIATGGGALPLEYDFELKDGTTRLAKDLVRLSTTGVDYLGHLEARIVTGASPGSTTFNVTCNRVTGSIGADVKDPSDSPFRFWIIDDSGDTTLVV